MFISKYVTEIESSDKEKMILYNQYNGSIFEIEKKRWIEVLNQLNTDISFEYEDVLLLIENRYIVDVENVPIFNKTSSYFLVTIEMSNLCNLDCIYCYQAEDGKRTEISENVVEAILVYIENVFILDEKKKELCVGFIGGEPLLHLTKVSNICKKIEMLGKKYKRKISFHIDTNGTIEFNELYQQVDNLHVSVSLSMKTDHNLKRRSSCLDSYEEIVCNLNGLEEKKGNSVTLRYNTDENNILQFEKFVAFIKKEIKICTCIEPMYTDMYQYNNYKNQLSLEDFIKWNSSEAIDTLVKYGYKIYGSINSSINLCIAYQEYSCKIYSDGIVTLCDSMFHDKSELTIFDIAKDVLSVWKHVSSITIQNMCVSQIF